MPIGGDLLLLEVFFNAGVWDELREAELASLVRASAESLGLQSLLGDYGFKVNIVVQSDASAAIGMVKREGLGKVRHLAVADLWVQQKQRTGAITYRKCAGKKNPSDMLTKGLSSDDIMRYLADLNIIPIKGRSSLAPKRVRRELQPARVVETQQQKWQGTRPNTRGVHNVQWRGEGIA